MMESFVKANTPDENIQVAEAVEVVEHALRKMKRGGARGGKPRGPSMNYRASRSRNPRECLKRAYEELGFSSLQQAKVWFEENPIDKSKKFNLNIKPKPLNIE